MVEGFRFARCKEMGGTPAKILDQFDRFANLRLMLRVWAQLLHLPVA